MQDLHLVMVYAEDGTTTLYRNGQPYGKPYRKGAATFPATESTVIFGIRHLPAGGNRHLSVSLAKARSTRAHLPRTKSPPRVPAAIISRPMSWSGP